MVLAWRETASGALQWQQAGSEVAQLSSEPAEVPVSVQIHWKTSLASFLQYLTVTRSRSQNTRRNADSVLSRFLAFLAIHYPEVGMAQLTQPILLEFLAAFQAPAYRYSILYYLRLFFDFAGIPDNPARRIRFPKLNPSQGVRFLERAELRTLISLIEHKVQTSHNLREQAIVLLVLFTGLRANEVLALKKEDLLTSGVSRIRDSKTHESRLAQIPPDVQRAIAKYHKRSPNPLNEYVFYPDRQGSSGPLAYNTLRSRLKALFIEAGISGHGKNLHALRHTFARSLVQGGFSRETIQKLLGHKSIRTTEIYTRLCEGDLLEKSVEAHRAVKTYIRPKTQRYKRTRRSPT